MPSILNRFSSCKKYLLGLSLWLVSLVSCKAQENLFLNYGATTNFIDSSQHYLYHLIPVEKYGALVVQEGFKRKWVIQRYDSQLTLVFSAQIKFASTQMLRHTDLVGNMLYMLTRSQHTAYHQLLMLNIENGELEAIHIPRILPMEYKTFHVLPPKVFMTGTIDRKPIVLLFDMHSRRNKVLPGIYQKRQFIDQAFKDNFGRYILVVRHTDSKKKGLDVRMFYPDSEEIENHFVDNTTDFNPDFVLAIDSTNMLGTFYTSNMDYPQGIFSLPLNRKAPPRRTFFKNFSGYVQHLSPREKQKYLRRKAKEVKKGKLPIIHQSMHVKPFNLEDGLVGISAENFHPYYESAQIPYANMHGFWSGASVMVGYQFNWMLTAVADMEGNIVWNQSAARKGIRTLELTSPTDFAIRQNWWLAAWPKDGELVYYFGNKDSILVDKHIVKTEALAKLTRFENLNMERMIPWDKNILLGIAKATVKDRQKTSPRIHWVLVKINAVYDQRKE